MNETIIILFQKEVHHVQFNPLGASTRNDDSA